MSRERELLARLEQESGGPTNTAKVLGVTYTGGYAKWKSGKAEVPKYILESIVAHLALNQLKGNYLKDLLR
jgi:hypothetical protein